LKSSLTFVCLALTACGSMSKKKDADENQSGFSRYLQDESKPGNAAATNPDGTPATNATPGTEAPVVPPAPTENATANANPPANANPTPSAPTAPAAPAAPQTPFGKPVPGKKGFVYSPFSDSNQMIDIRDYQPGQKVRDPYTNKIFIVP
jgi:hypothetical protein